MGLFLHKVRGQALYSITTGGSFDDPKDIRRLRVSLAKAEAYLSDFPPHNLPRLEDDLKEAKAEVRQEKRLARAFHYEWEDEESEWGERLKQAQWAYDQAHALEWLRTHQEDEEDAHLWALYQWIAGLRS